MALAKQLIKDAKLPEAFKNNLKAQKLALKPKLYEAEKNLPIEDIEINRKIVKCGYHVKFDDQLARMMEQTALKIDEMQKRADTLIKYPQWYKDRNIKEPWIFENERRIKKGKEPIYEISEENIQKQYDHKLEGRQEILASLNESLFYLSEELRLRLSENVLRDKKGTAYYVDSSQVTGQITGTWTFTNASTAVTANSDGNAVAELTVGDHIKVSDGDTWYYVATITDDDNLVITPAFQEANVTDTTDATDYNDEDGSASNQAYPVLENFSQTSRSEGDYCKVRRGCSENVGRGLGYNGGLYFSSNGWFADPLYFEADYDNTWSDRVDLSGTGTATLTAGSKTVTFSADVSGVLSAGDWIYASGDDARLYAYEVKTVSTVTVTLYLPYKGDQAGSGKTMYNMQSAPVYGETANTYGWNYDGALLWIFRGIHVKSTDADGVLEVDGTETAICEDMVFEGAGVAADYGVKLNDDPSQLILYKCRFKEVEPVYQKAGASYCYQARVMARDCLAEDIADNEPFVNGQRINLFIDECEIDGVGSSPFLFEFAGAYTLSFGDIKARNVKGAHATVPVNTPERLTYMPFGIGIEDNNGVIGKSIYFQGGNSSDILFQGESDTGTVRSGGSNRSIKITPATATFGGVGKGGPHKLSIATLLEIPIYLPASEKTITVYFASQATAAWTASPDNTELYLELDYLCNNTTKVRKLLRSSGAVDFTTDTDFDQSLAVTVTPSTAGMAYLKVRYAKAVEDGKTNLFYLDPIPIIT